MFFLAALILVACAGEETTKRTKRANKFTGNAALLEVLVARNELDHETLLTFLEHEEPDVREQAAMAFGSMGDTIAQNALRKALRDRAPAVRCMSAFALGQLGQPADVRALLEHLSKEDHPEVRIAILRATGRCADEEQLNLVRRFQPESKADSIGLMWAAYQLSLKQLADSTMTASAVACLTAPNAWLRDVPAFVLSRSNPQWLEPHAELLAAALDRERIPEVRMALCRALGKVSGDSAYQALHKAAALDPDPRVRQTAIQAICTTNHFEQARPMLPTLLNDNDPLVRETVAGQLSKGLDVSALPKLMGRAEKESDARVQAKLYSTLLVLITDSTMLVEVKDKIKSEFEQAEDRYEKAAWLLAWKNDQTALENLKDITFSAEDPVISTAGMEAIISVHRKFGVPDGSDMIGVYEKALHSSDLTLIGLTAGALLEFQLEDERTTGEKLKAIQKTLSLPKEVEAWIELQKAINWLNGTDADVDYPTTNAPLDLEHIQSIPKDQKVLLQTVKGEIVIELYVEEAPTTASSFLKSVKTGYYDGKTFHRVVPNFVVQGGCPRGDGWGAPDWNLRSEFTARHYVTGSVGLASAGRDTESVQFFITHSPAPFLDGRYPLFGQVVKGMEVVQQLGVGDVIEKMEVVP